MDFSRLPEYLARARQLLFTEGHLNQRFLHLETIEKECNVEHLVENCVYTFCDQAEKVIKEIEEQMENIVVDYRMLEDTVTRLRSYIVSVGADHMLTKVNQLKQIVKDRSDIMSCKIALRELKLESARFEDEMNDYFLMLWHGACYSYRVDALIENGLLDPITLHLRRR